MNRLAHHISVRIKEANPEETASVEIMQYALAIIFNSLIIFAGTALTGWLLGHFKDTMLFLISFSLLRFLSGGFHLKTAAACNLATILLCTMAPTFIHIPNQWVWIPTAISLLIMLVLAPNPDHNAQVPRHLFPLLKILAMALVILNFFMNSAVIGLAFVLQSLTIIPWTERRDTHEKIHR